MNRPCDFIAGAEIIADAMSATHVSLLPHLELALRHALIDLVYVDDAAAFERLRISVLRSALPASFSDIFGAANADTTPGYTALIALTDRIVQIGGEPDINDLWTNPGFVAPAIAALALMLERILHPSADSRMTIHLREDHDSLYGYRLIDLQASGFAISTDGEMSLTMPSEGDLRELTAHLAGAAYFFLRGDAGLKIGSRYLKYIAVRSPAPGRTSPEDRASQYVVFV